MKLYFDSLTTLKVIHAESPVVIFFGTYGTDLLPVLTTTLIVCAYSLTACEPASLLVGRSFKTLTVPNLKFPNNDSACERSYYHIQNGKK